LSDFQDCFRFETLIKELKLQRLQLGRIRQQALLRIITAVAEES